MLSSPVRTQSRLQDGETQHPWVLPSMIDVVGWRRFMAACWQRHRNLCHSCQGPCISAAVRVPDTVCAHCWVVRMAICAACTGVNTQAARCTYNSLANSESAKREAVELMKRTLAMFMATLETLACGNFPYGRAPKLRRSAMAPASLQACCSCQAQFR